tara:strand:+ start:3779 stop:6643 length:2865 start_codon:yes stop_codon:yes gene_type:complete
MDTRIFLRRLLPDDGYYVLWCYKQDIKRHKQTSFTSIDELAATANEYDTQGWDAYFALGSFNEENTRKAVDVKRLKSFFLDLDCGPSKPHPTQADALRDLQDFCTKVKLPKPLIVNSGRGIHVYWILSESVSLQDWKPVAEKFKALCAKHDFEIDTAVPADAARVLRVLNTYNYKPEQPAKVELIGKDVKEVNFDHFASLVGYDSITVPTKREQQSSDAFADLIAKTKENSFKDILLKTGKGEGCEQLRQIMVNQESTSEPLWRAGLSIAKFCIDGEKASHKLSEKHPEYAAELTQEKTDLIKGPYRCATFDETNPNVCPDCPHWGKIKSPIVIGRRYARTSDKIIPATDVPDPDQETTISTPVVETGSVNISSEDVIPLFPRPYFRGSNGGVFYREVGADGEIDESMVYHNDIYVTKRLNDVEVGESAVIRLFLPKDGLREFTVPLTAITSREEFRKNMSMHGVVANRMEDLMKYITTWINELQASSVADTAHRQFGWVDEECKAFVVGSKEIRADDISHNPPTNPTAAVIPYLQPKGTIEGWKNMANFYTTKSGMEMHQYIVCTAFGSPLMEFLPQHCSTLHLWSNGSGFGKTSAMRVAANVWGEDKAMMLDFSDTNAMKMNRGEVLHNLPFYIDELTNPKGELLSDLAYQLSGGQQRGRMSQGSNIERSRGRPWQLLCVTTGNSSVIEKISLKKGFPKAEAQRIMECRAKRVFTEVGEKELTDAFEEQINQHVGHVGEMYIQHVIKNLESVKKLVRDVQGRADRAADLSSENRFWSAGVACTITGGIIASKLGLIDYDMEALFDWAVELLTTNKKSVSDMGVSVEQTLNDYIMEHYGNVLWIKSTDDLRKQDTANGLDSLVVPDVVPRVKFVARYETDLKKAYLLPKPLKQWCGEQQINYTGFVEDLISKLGAKRVKMRLSKGTMMNLPPTNVIAVNCAVGDAHEDNLLEE